MDSLERMREAIRLSGIIDPYSLSEGEAADRLMAAYRAMKDYRVPPRKKVTVRVETEGLPDFGFEGLLDHIEVVEGEGRATVVVDDPRPTETVRYCYRHLLGCPPDCLVSL